MTRQQIIEELLRIARAMGSYEDDTIHVHDSYHYRTGEWSECKHSKSMDVVIAKEQFVATVTVDEDDDIQVRVDSWTVDEVFEWDSSKSVKDFEEMLVNVVG